MERNSLETGSEYVLDALEREGVTDLFGLIGKGNSHLLDAASDSSVEFHYGRHEQAAVTMADGFARITGDVGVCTVTLGPGVTNAATGIAMADRDNVPMVVIIGDTSVEGRENSLQYFDHATFTRPIAPYFTRVEGVATLRAKIRSAFDEARRRSGPAVLELPIDVQKADAPDASYQETNPTTQRPHPDPECVEAASELLEKAENPVVLAGGGVAKSGATDAVLALAETMGAPVATTYYAKDAVPESHPLVTGIGGTFMTPASEAVLWDADAVLAVGTRLSSKVTCYGDLYADAEVVQIDIDASAIGRYSTPSVGVVSDARAACEALSERLMARPDRADDVRETIRAAGAPSDVEFESDPDRIDPRELTVEVARRVPSDALVTVDSGNHTGFPPVFHEMDGTGRMLVNGNFGSMGYSLPAALGAQVAKPEHAVVAYVGDGSFLMVLQALETAVRNELPVVVVVYDDASYGIIRHRQYREFGRSTATEYESPDFETVARGLGAEAAVVRSAADLDVIEDHLERESTTPLVLDAMTMPEISRPGFPPY